MKTSTQPLLIAITAALQLFSTTGSCGNEGKTKAGVVLKNIDDTSYTTFAKAMKRPDPVPATETIDGLIQARNFIARLRIDEALRVKMHMAMDPSISRLYFKADPQDVSKSNYKAIERDYQNIIKQLNIKKKNTFVAAVTESSKTYLIKAFFENKTVEKNSKAAILIHEMFRVLMPWLPTSKVIQLEVAAEDYMDGIDFISFYYHLADAFEMEQIRGAAQYGVTTAKKNFRSTRMGILFNGFLDHDFSVGAIPGKLLLKRTFNWPSSCTINGIYCEVKEKEQLFPYFHAIAQEYPESLIAQMFREVAANDGLSVAIKASPHLQHAEYNRSVGDTYVKQFVNSKRPLGFDFEGAISQGSHVLYRTCIPTSELTVIRDYSTECAVMIDLDLDFNHLPEFPLESLASWRTRK